MNDGTGRYGYHVERKVTPRARVVPIVLALSGGLTLTLALALAVLLTQDDVAMELMRFMQAFVTLPVALFSLATLVAVSATAIAYGFGVESRYDESGKSHCLYRSASRSEANPSSASVSTTQVSEAQGR